MSIQKNTAGQVIPMGTMLDTAGAPVTSGVTVEVVKDNGAAASGAGTATHKSQGAWTYAPTQSETNADSLLVIFSKTGAVPISQPIITQDHPRTAIPAAASGAANGLPVLDVNGRTNTNIQAVAGTAVAGVNDFKASGFAVAGDAMTLTTGERSSVAAAVWASTTRSLTTFGTIVADVVAGVWAAGSRTLTAFAFGVTVTTNNDKTGYALTEAERTAIADEVEFQIIDEADPEKVLTAITNKIAEANPDLSGLTLAAIAVAIRNELAVELARIDATISSRLAAAGYTTPPTAAANAAEVAGVLEAAHGGGAWTTANVTGLATAAALTQTEEKVDGVKVTADRLAGMLEADGDVHRFTANALEQAPAGGCGGGGLTTEQDATLSAIHAKTQLIGTGAAPTVSTAVLNGGRIELYKGVDYVASIGMAIEIIDADASNLPAAGSTVRIQARHNELAAYFEADGVIVEPGDGSRIARFDVPRTTTEDAPEARNYRYLLFEIIGADELRKLNVAGPLTVNRGITGD